MNETILTAINGRKQIHNIQISMVPIPPFPTPAIFIFIQFLLLCLHTQLKRSWLIGVPTQKHESKAAIFVFGFKVVNVMFLCHHDAKWLSQQLERI